jgi:tetratricopeptide (TPR) repeat protein
VRFFVRPALTPYWELRLFRNHPALRFEGVIHENIWPALLRLVDTRALDVRRLPLSIDHIGYEANQERKNARNLPLLERAVQSDPDHVYCWAELGRIHYEQGNLPGARNALWAGANVVRSKAAIVGQDSLPFAWLARIGMETGDPAPAPVIAEAQALFPEHPQLIWLQGQLALRNKSFSEAAECFQTLAKVDPDAFIDAAMAYDRRLFGAWSVAGLAACHLATGHYADAAALFADAARLDPTDMEYRVKQAMANRLAGGVR